MSLKLHSDRSFRRGLTALSKALRRSREIEKIPGWVAEEKLRAGEVKLPGFHIFTNGGVISPYEWLLPRPPGDESTLIYAYEAFADRPLGGVGRPGEMPSAVFREVSPNGGRRLGLEDEIIATRWKHPALLLLGYAQRFTEQTVSSRGGVYSLHISSAYMEVTPNGCYSNFRRGIVPAEIPNNDTVEELFSVPGVISRDPLVRALHRIADDVGYGALLALNTVACGLYHRKLTSRNVLEALRGKAVAMGPRSYLVLGKNGERTVGTLLSGCADAVGGLRNGEIQDLEALHEVLVPVAYTERQFRVAFGNPEANPHRRVRPQTLLAWANRIEVQAERLKRRGINADA